MKALLICMLVTGVSATSILTKIELRAVGNKRTVAPNESVILRLIAHGSTTDKSGKTRSFTRSDSYNSIKADAGYFCKPFAFSQEESDVKSDEGRSSFWSGILKQALGNREVLDELVYQDAVLYTAPDKPGLYKIEATKGKLTASLEIEVKDATVPNTQTQEFAPEAESNDPYWQIAEHYAPFIAAETWFQPKADYLARFDFDGDWDGANNWENLYRGSSQAYVYYTVMETATHWFIIYNIFHPRDYSDRCLAGTCHENDNEGLILTVRKNGSPMGQLQIMETLAHDQIYSYSNDPRVKNRIHNIDGRIELYEGSHPAIFIESGGHGIYGASDSRSRYTLKTDSFISSSLPNNTGVTYIYRGRAERPRHPNDRMVGYALLPIYEHWWKRAGQGDTPEAFDDFFIYQPSGNRPKASRERIPAAFRGRERAKNKARPFWGWRDRRTRKVLSAGQWGLDPAYSVTQSLNVPQPFSLDYTYNPYLKSR